MTAVGESVNLYVLHSLLIVITMYKHSWQFPGRSIVLLLATSNQITVCINLSVSLMAVDAVRTHGIIASVTDIVLIWFTSSQVVKYGHRRDVVPIRYTSQSNLVIMATSSCILYSSDL